MWRTYCCLTGFFPIVDTCLSCEDTAQQCCVMVPRWRFFASFLRPVFPASCVQHTSDLHSNTPFTRYNRLYNRFDNWLYRVNKHPIQPVVKPHCTTGLTTGCIHDTAGCQTVVECLYTRYNRLLNRFDNRLHRVNRA